MIDDSGKRDEVSPIDEQEADLLAELLLGQAGTVETGRPEGRLFAPVVPPRPVNIDPETSPGLSLFAAETDTIAGDSASAAAPAEEPGRLFSGVVSEADGTGLAAPLPESRSVNFVPVERTEAQDDDRRRRVIVVVALAAAVAIGILFALTSNGDRTEVDTSGDPAPTSVRSQDDEPSPTSTATSTEATPETTAPEPTATTDAPASTEPPTTSRPPVTDRPTVTAPPVTAVPTTAVPTTAVPTTAVPTTAAPVTRPEVTFPKPTWTAPPVESTTTTTPPVTTPPTTATATTAGATDSTAP